MAKYKVTKLSRQTVVVDADSQEAAIELLGKYPELLWEVTSVDTYSASLEVFNHG